MGTVAEQIPRVRGRPRAFDQQAALDRAMMLFWRQGYEPTSLSDLSRAMGLNAPSIYAAFGNKERLFLRVLDRYLETRMGEIERGFQTPSTAEAALRDFLMLAARRFTDPRKPPGCLVVLAAARVSPQARTIQSKLRHRRRRREALLRARIQQAIDAGELPIGTRAAPLAKFYATVFQGMAMQAADGASRAELKAVAKEAMAAWPDVCSANTSH
jgi:AcrR family transcriptional regulator